MSSFEYHLMIPAVNRRPRLSFLSRESPANVCFAIGKLLREQSRGPWSSSCQVGGPYVSQTCRIHCGILCRHASFAVAHLCGRNETPSGMGQNSRRGQEGRQDCPCDSSGHRATHRSRAAFKAKVRFGSRAGVRARSEEREPNRGGKKGRRE